jgi:exopolysaccharide biosynthesis protein
MLLSRYQNAGHNYDIKIANRCFKKCGKIHIFGNENNKSKLDSGGNQEQIQFGQCLLPFNLAPFVFSPAV